MKAHRYLSLALTGALLLAAGGCGAVKRTRDIVSVASILVSRYDVKPQAEIFVV